MTEKEMHQNPVIYKMMKLLQGGRMSEYSRETKYWDRVEGNSHKSSVSGRTGNFKPLRANIVILPVEAAKNEKDEQISSGVVTLQVGKKSGLNSPKGNRAQNLSPSMSKTSLAQRMQMIRNASNSSIRQQKEHAKKTTVGKGNRLLSPATV